MNREEAYYLFGLPLLKVTRFRVAIAVLLLVFSSSSIAFSTWSNNNWESQFDIIVDSDNFFSVIKVDSSNQEKKLVPMNSFVGSNDTYYYTYVYEIAVSEAGMLNIYTDNYSVIGLDDINQENVFNVQFSLDNQITFIDSLIEINLSDDGIYYDAENEVYLITLHVRLSMQEQPSINEDEIEILKNNTVEFDLVFRMNDTEIPRRGNAR
jgi:hypothetical protein